MTEQEISQRPRALLLDSISVQAEDTFVENGIDVGYFDKANFQSAAELGEEASGFQVLGVRSGPEVTPDVIVPSLDAIAVFGNGTNHITRTTEDGTGVDDKGVALINASVENTRSVSELVTGFILGLARNFPAHAELLSKNQWSKKNGIEVRGETLGIIGYGAIGTQVSVIAEALGMDVLAYDKYTTNVNQGRTEMVQTKEELLERSRFVTLNTPLTDETKGMIDEKAIERIGKDSYLINAARSELMVVNDVIDALQSERLGGLGVDVYEGKDPSKFGHSFDNPYRGLPNVLQTPHVGGSTVQAQNTIGSRVAGAVAEYINTGNSLGAINIPRLNLGALLDGTSRLLNIHDNHQGVSTETKRVISEFDLNIIGALLDAPKGSEIGYEAIDVDGAIPDEALTAIKAMDATRRARVISSV